MLKYLNDLLVRNVYAQNSDLTTLHNPLTDLFGNDPTLASIFGFAMNVVIAIGVAITVIFLAMGGIKYVTSEGDKTKADEARQALTNAIIGFVIVLGAITLQLAIGNLLQADLPNNITGSLLLG